MPRAFIAKSTRNARSRLSLLLEVMNLGRPRKYNPDRVTTAVRIPAELHVRLQEEAEARDVSLNYLLVRGAQLVLDRLAPLSQTEEQLRQEAS